MSTGDQHHSTELADLVKLSLSPRRAVDFGRVTTGRFKLNKDGIAFDDFRKNLGPVLRARGLADNQSSLDLKDLESVAHLKGTRDCSS